MRTPEMRAYPWRVAGSAAVAVTIMLAVLLCGRNVVRLWVGDSVMKMQTPEPLLSLTDPLDWETGGYPQGQDWGGAETRGSVAMMGGLYPPMYAAVRGFGFLDDYFILPRINLMWDWEEGQFAFDHARGVFVWWLDENGYGFAGPEGTSREAWGELGRFEDPVWAREGRLLVVWDRSNRRFMGYDLADGSWRAGPVMPEEFECKELGSIPDDLWVYWRPPQVWEENAQNEWVDAAGFASGLKPRFVPVLLGDGRVARLEPNALAPGEVVGNVMAELRPEGGLDSLLVYEAVFMSHEGEHQGMAVGVVSGDARDAALWVHGPNGVTGKSVRAELWPSARVLDDRPGATIAVGMEWLLEALHPPVLMLGTFVVGRPGEALEGWRSLLWRPYGLVTVGLRRMWEKEGWVEALPAGLGMLTPGLIVSGILALLVGADAKRLGFGRRGRKVWMWAVFLGGVVVWLVWRVSRPGVELVTCGSCGRGRRVDFAVCQRCGAGWRVVELEAPGFQIKN